ncbi:MAG: TRAP transporter substrate-binding protein [Eubacteriales bacterium]|nr:TRAP transporter substrate-binding protein [Eubacteriales bacterium]
MRERKYRVISFLLTAALMVTLLAGCGKSSSSSENTSSETETKEETQEAITLQWGYTPPAEGEDSKLHMQIGDLVSEYTDGAVTYEYYAGGALGNEKVSLEGVVSGTINQASISPNVVATVAPEFNVLCLPFLFDDVNHFYRVISSDEYYEKMNEVANSVGLQYLGEEFFAPRTIGTLKPVYTPDDADGQILRVMDGTIYTDMMKLWGFGSSVIAYGETYTAVQQGVVDGLENSNDGNLSMKFYEVIDYSTNTYHVYHGQATFMNLDQWNALTADTQEAIKKAWKEVSAESIKKFPALYEEQAQQMRDNGVEVIDLTDEQRQTWKDASEPLYEQYRGVIGEDFYDWFMELVESQR